MKKFDTLFKIFLASFTIFVFFGCEIDSFAEEDEYAFGDITAPTNVQISAAIVGKDADNPNGDGSGEVNFSGSADNAITYKYVYDGVEKMSPDGNIKMTFSKLGLNTYTVTIVAIGKGGTTSSKAVTVDVLVTYSPPAALVAALTTGKWRVKAEEWRHMGVGPSDAPEPWWWGANPFDKASTGMYDDRYTFHADGKFGFDVGPDGQIFGKADPMEADLGGDRGQTRNGDNEFTNYPFDSFDSTWSISAPGGVETINFSGLGFMGFYVGSHDYVILARSSNRMVLRTVGSGGLGWFWIITNDN